VKQLLKRIAAEGAKTQELHDQLDFLRRSMLRRQNDALMARIFAGAVDFSGWDPNVRYESWHLLWTSYLGWTMAHDDAFWTAMHHGADEPWHR
jgi:hypothetical protein